MIEDSLKPDAILLECSSVQLPIVLLTTTNQMEDLVNKLELSANDYRTKPISKEEFLAHLKKKIDISKLKTESVQLEIEKQAAKLASQTKTAFFANMSHELRTPLNGILGYAQILRRGQNLDENQLSGLNAIYQNGNHLLTLINDILELSRMEAHKLALYPDIVHFSNFIEEITGIYRLQAEQKNISFSYEAIGDLPVGINVDNKRLRQILIHILNNAIKFTDTGQVIFRVVIIIDKRNYSVKKGTIPFDRKNSESVTLRFEVEDTGVGMTPEQLKKIFLPFEQVGDAIRQAEGTGLGLSISRQLVELMGGEIFVESEVNKGSFFCFEITLPVVDSEATDAQQFMKCTGYKGERQNILVVDDRSDNRMILSNMLTEMGFKVIEAKNGKESVDKAKKNKLAVIFMDLVMPVMTGFEAVQIIRKIPDFNNTLIIATSATVFEADQEKSLIAGCDVFLPKPIEEDKLLKILINRLKLEWTYADIVEETSQKEVSDAPLIPPPKAELEAVYELAMEGRMRQVREKAAHIEELDEKYIPFARKIQQLAKSFEDEQIIALVEKYLEENK